MHQFELALAASAEESPVFRHRRAFRAEFSTPGLLTARDLAISNRRGPRTVCEG
jgi:hypothetical protein